MLELESRGIDPHTCCEKYNGKQNVLNCIFWLTHWYGQGPYQCVLNLEKWFELGHDSYAKLISEWTMALRKVKKSLLAQCTLLSQLFTFSVAPRIMPPCVMKSGVVSGWCQLKYPNIWASNLGSTFSLNWAPSFCCFVWKSSLNSMLWEIRWKCKS